MIQTLFWHTPPHRRQKFVLKREVGEFCNKANVFGVNEYNAPSVHPRDAEFMNSGSILECCDQAEASERVSLKNGVYQVRVCFGTRDGAMDVALHGVMTLEDACEASRIFDGCGRISTAWASGD